MKGIGSLIRKLMTLVLVVIAYGNIWTFVRKAAALPPRDADGMVLQEDRYRTIRQSLIALGYGKGPVGYITNRDVRGEPRIEEDNIRWAYGEYTMIPWVLVKDGKSASGPFFKTDLPYVVGDFWDGAPAEIPRDLIPVHDTGKGLILFRRKSEP